MLRKRPDKKRGSILSSPFSSKGSSQRGGDDYSVADSDISAGTVSTVRGGSLAMPRGAVLLCGFLHKRSRKGKWQKRYFTLDKYCLSYFASAHSLHALAVIDLRGVVDVEESDVVGNENMSFVLIGKNDDEASSEQAFREYHLRAESPAVRSAWMSKVKHVIKRIRRWQEKNAAAAQAVAAPKGILDLKVTMPAEEGQEDENENENASGEAPNTVNIESVTTSPDIKLIIKKASSMEKKSAKRILGNPIPYAPPRDAARGAHRKAITHMRAQLPWTSLGESHRLAEDIDWTVFGEGLGQYFMILRSLAYIFFFWGCSSAVLMYILSQKEESHISCLNRFDTLLIKMMFFEPSKNFSDAQYNVSKERFTPLQLTTFYSTPCELPFEYYLVLLVPAGFGFLAICTLFVYSTSRWNALIDAAWTTPADFTVKMQRRKESKYWGLVRDLDPATRALPENMSASEIKLHFEQWGTVARVYLHVVPNSVLNVHERRISLTPHVTEYMGYNKDTIPGHLKSKWRKEMRRLEALTLTEGKMVEDVGNGKHSAPPFAFVTFVREKDARACAKAYAASRRDMQTRAILLGISIVKYVTAVLVYPYKRMVEACGGVSRTCDREVEMSDASSDGSAIHSQLSAQMDIEAQRQVLAQPKQSNAKRAKERSMTEHSNISTTSSFGEKRKKIALAMRSNRVDLKVERSPEPDDVIWGNLEVIGYQRICRYSIISFVFLTCMSLYSMVILYVKVYSFCIESRVDTDTCFDFMKEHMKNKRTDTGNCDAGQNLQDDESILVSFGLVVGLSSLKWLITQTIIPWCVAFLRCHTIGSEEMRLFVLTAFFDYACLVFITQGLSNVTIRTYENLCFTNPEAKLKTFADQGAFLAYIFFSDLLVMLFMRLFQPYERCVRYFRVHGLRVGSWILVPAVHTQSEMNSYYTPPVFSLGKEYAMLAKVILITLQFTARYPMLFCVTFVHVFSQYWLDKYCLLNNTRIKGNVGNRVGKVFLVFMPIFAFFPAWPEMYSQGEYSVWNLFDNNETAIVQEPWKGTSRFWLFTGVTTTGTIWFAILWLLTRSGVRMWFKENGCARFLGWCLKFETYLRRDSVDEEEIMRAESNNSIVGAVAGVLDVFASSKTNLPWRKDESKDFRLVQEEEDDDQMTYWRALTEEFRTKVAYSPPAFHTRHLYEGSVPKPDSSAIARQLSTHVASKDQDPEKTPLLTSRLAVQSRGLKAWTGALASKILQGDKSLKWVPYNACLFLDRLVLNSVNIVPRQTQTIPFETDMRVSKLCTHFKSVKVKKGRPYSFTIHKPCADNKTKGATCDDVVALCSAVSSQEFELWIEAIDYCIKKKANMKRKSDILASAADKIKE